jgi:hypothetical protein
MSVLLRHSQRNNYPVRTRGAPAEMEQTQHNAPAAPRAPTAVDALFFESAFFRGRSRYEHREVL